MTRVRVDELHVTIAPIVLGDGERLFEDIDIRSSGYECLRFVALEKATHPAPGR